MESKVLVVDLPLYQCHKKVKAALINAVKEAETEGCKVLVLQAPNEAADGYASVEVDAAWLTRNPAVEVGGYFVHYCENADDYTAYSPAGPFESGYTLIDGTEEPADANPEKEYIAIRMGQLPHRGLIEKGTIFKWAGPRGSWMQPYGWEPEEQQKPEGPLTMSTIMKQSPPPAGGEVGDKKALMEELSAMGVNFFKGASAEALQAKLDEVKGAA